MKKWHENQRGSVFLMVLAVLMLASFLMMSLFTLTIQSVIQRKTVQSPAQALRNAESAINIAQVKISNAISPVQAAIKNNPNMPASTVLQQLITALSPLNNQKQSVNNLFDYTISFQFPQDVTAGNLQIPISIVATGYDGSVAKQLQQNMVISSVVQSLAYAVYAPDTIFMSGGVYINGSIATSSKSSSNSIYVSDYPWLGTLLSDDNFIPQSQGKQNAVFNPVTCNGLEKPGFSNSSTITTGNIYKYSTYDDMSRESPTYYFGQAAHVSDEQVVNSNQLNTIFSGVPLIASQAPSFDSSYVQTIVDSQFNNMNSIPNLTTKKPGQLNGDLSAGKTINTPLHVTGDVSIRSNQTLNVNGPVYIDGDLDVQGNLNVNGVIYVKGNVSIHNVPQQQNGDDPPRLQIWADGSVVVNVVVSASGGKQTQIPTQPIKWRAFLASAQPMLLGGIFGYYQLTGGVTAPTIILNASYGTNLSYDGTNVYNVNQDMTPRLTITSDPTLVTQPMQGTPTMSDLHLDLVGNPVLQN
jgi:hypothetical protein